MSGFALLYGRTGQTAAGDPQVAELLNRTVDQQPRATALHDDALSKMRTAQASPWTEPVSTMAATQSRWLAAMLWQMATSYLDGVVEAFWSQDQLPLQVFKECDSLCDRATEVSMRAVRLMSEANVGQRPTNATLESLPAFAITSATCSGVWRAFEAIAAQVASDFAVIDELGYPKHMRDVYQTALTAYKPQADLFDFQRANWATSRTADSLTQIARDALPIAQALFTVGQQLWAPYLLGQVYTIALRYKPTLEDLELPFDPWIFTGPAEKERRIKDQASRDELTRFWSSVADKAAVVQIANQLAEAVKTRRIRLRIGRVYPTVPWPTQYLVRFPITIGDRTFQTGDLVVVYASTNEQNQFVVEVRKTGRLTSVLDLLGQPRQ